mmetsp:Transcript_5038/g.12893  ORF Transcript_5038/g.12893 Transcript_5038/m.12893 type:complete len:208 (-) Transcript_5038:611-1234(-)
MFRQHVSFSVTCTCLLHGRKHRMFQELLGVHPAPLFSGAWIGSNGFVDASKPLRRPNLDRIVRTGNHAIIDWILRPTRDHDVVVIDVTLVVRELIYVNRSNVHDIVPEHRYTCVISFQTLGVLFHERPNSIDRIPLLDHIFQRTRVTPTQFLVRKVFEVAKTVTFCQVFMQRFISCVNEVLLGAVNNGYVRNAVPGASSIHACVHLT